MARRALLLVCCLATEALLPSAPLLSSPALPSRTRLSATEAKGGFGSATETAAPKKVYSTKTLRTLAKRFDSLKKTGSIVDVYAGASDGDKLFFLGKVASPKNADAAASALRWCLKSHAAALQAPLTSRQLDYFFAPGDTELAVAKGESVPFFDNNMRSQASSLSAPYHARTQRSNRATSASRRRFICRGRRVST